MKEGKLQNLWFRLNVQLTRKEKLIFSKYLAVLLGAGLAIDEAIDILRAQSKRSMHRILEALYESLNRGGYTLVWFV